MTPLIPALINMLVSGIRKRGGGGGGYGGGGYGGKPQMSDAEKDDKYWANKNMSAGMDGDDFAKAMGQITSGMYKTGGDGSNAFDRAMKSQWGDLFPKK
jgi:hypothetical protein